LQSWAHTPVGNPIAGLADGLQALVTGQRTDAEALTQERQQRAQNLTVQALRGKDVPDEDIAAAMGNPEIMKQLITQHFGPDPTIAVPSGSRVFDKRTGRFISDALGRH
jgi:hypothetical protein